MAALHLGTMSLTLLVALSCAAPIRSPSEQLKQQLQTILDKHAAFWNSSFSLAVYNDTVDVTVAAGLNDYAAKTRLTPNNGIPAGSTTKMFTAAMSLRLAQNNALDLDDKVHMGVDTYLAKRLPCGDAPEMCKEQCVPYAHCYVKPDLFCKIRSKEKQATCSYCFRYLHCYSQSTNSVPKALTLRQIWDDDARIEEVTFRHLLSMSSGIKDYYDDRTNWLFNQVLGSARDVEPLEYLVHQDHGFLFSPGETMVVPKGNPGAGQTVTRGAYSTNGFSLVGLALAGILNMTHWYELDQRALAWGAARPDDDELLFPTRGTCLKHESIAHQYNSEHEGEAFSDISNHSCLNSWLGGNIASPPREVARFAHALFATETVIDKEHRKQMTTLHPMTDSFGAWQLAYGLGLEALWNGDGGDYTKYCGYHGLGHGGLDYGSGSPSNGYFPELGVAIFLGSTAGISEGLAVAGMACNRSYDQLTKAYSLAWNDVLNAVSQFAGHPATCPTSSYSPPAASDCRDAASFGTLSGHDVSCSEIMKDFTSSHKVSKPQLCQWFGSTTLTGVKSQINKDGKTDYEPPHGVDPDTTIADTLCKATCLAVGMGPCWLRGPSTPWCNQ